MGADQLSLRSGRVICTGICKLVGGATNRDRDGVRLRRKQGEADCYDQASPSNKTSGSRDHRNFSDSELPRSGKSFNR